MNLKTFIKKQFEDFIEVYDKYLIRTSGITLTYTLFCFLAIALLAIFSDFDPSVLKKQFSLLSYFFTRYSKGNTYSIVDLSKTVFIFFVSFFSLGLTRSNLNKQENTELKITNFLKQIFVKDILELMGILFLCSIIDYVLFQIDRFSNSNIDNNDFHVLLHGFILLFRVYIPLIFFGLTTYRLSSNKKFKINFKKLIFLFISLWFFNEFAYELSIFVRNHIFGFILLPFSAEKQYFVESFIGMILIAFYFVGYHSAMVSSLKILDDEN